MIVGARDSEVVEVKGRRVLEAVRELPLFAIRRANMVMSCGRELRVWGRRWL